MYKIYLKKNEEKRILNGSNTIYANEVYKIIDKDINGSLSNVYTYDGVFLGKGYINHLSKVLVRLFIKDENEIDDINLFTERIKKANDYRLSIGYSSSYRMVFSEADLLPGLIIDKYDDILVIEISSLGMDKKKDLIVKVLVDLFNPKGIYERCEENLRTKEGLKSNEGVLYGEVRDSVIITENDLLMSVHVKTGQKTGYFLDQKENRLAIRKYTKDLKVLDCFSNSGGFSVNAALNAKEVYALDISKVALDNVLENAKLNNLNNVKVIEGDVFEKLREFRKNKEKFDMIILDPPAFTKSVSEVNDALRGYKDINVLAMKLINDGGYLVSSSCSHFITPPLFSKMLIESARIAKRDVKCIEIKSQAPDHPSLLLSDETQYLKFYVLKIN
ncbi:MAG: class I SAM-dependent rRNA methyltransferase [Gammaproteobacteria bacterium]|nr:class I SAM-dependent rRNA methyltransferase [Gammaproteobacteria bacterium]